MPRWTIVFLVIASIAAFYSFAGVQGYSSRGARALFHISFSFATLAFLGRVFGKPSAR